MKQMKAALEAPDVIVTKEEPKVDKPADVSKRDPEPPVPGLSVTACKIMDDFLGCVIEVA